MSRHTSRVGASYSNNIYSCTITFPNSQMANKFVAHAAKFSHMSATNTGAVVLFQIEGFDALFTVLDALEKDPRIIVRR